MYAAVLANRSISSEAFASSSGERSVWKGAGMKTHKMWTNKEVAKLCELFPIMKSSRLAAGFPGRTWLSIKNKANELGLKLRNRERPRPRQSKWLVIASEYRPVIFAPRRVLRGAWAFWNGKWPTD
jgi:hypothetical protein